MNNNWAREWNALMEDEWLKEKLDRKKVFAEHLNYLNKLFPEVFIREPSLVIDIGPGVGMLLEIAREAGHKILGIDIIPTEFSGMGKEYVKACELMWFRQSIRVEQIGARTFFKESTLVNKALLINMRGSFEQVFCDHFNEPIISKSKESWWVFTEGLEQDLNNMISSMYNILQSNGTVLISPNGSMNSDNINTLLTNLAKQSGFVIDSILPLYHRWRKV